MRIPIEFESYGSEETGKKEQLEITGSLIIRKLRVGLNIVKFVVDTGCDISFIGYGDALKMGIPLNMMSEKEETHIGNTTFSMMELPPFEIALESDEGTKRISVNGFYAADTKKKAIKDVEHAKAIPSILGLDFLRKNNLSLHVEPLKNMAYFEKEIAGR